MSSINWLVPIQDILQSVTEIEERIGGITFEEFAKNSTIIKAILYDFVIIGKATINVPNDI
ncbi:MAG: HepT-like ribonuclease domain-containing protein [Microcoleaceae cyanobacterium]